MHIPPQHQGLMPYLVLNNAAAFTRFTQNVFNAAITVTQKRENSELYMHCELQVNGQTIMYCDATPEWPPATAHLFVYTENADDSFHKAIAAGATVVMELRNEPYGRTCGVTDPCGNTWWITSVL